MTISSSRIILTGFSGTGKTAVGRRVAATLGWQFVDSDEWIVQQAGKPVDRIFAEDGEPAFRALERKAIRELCSRSKVVVSTGGGSIMNDENRQVMLDSGFLVALEARPETIYARLARAQEGGSDEPVRPLLRPIEGQDPLIRVENMKRDRQWAYALAHWTVPTDALSTNQVAAEVVRAWRRMGSMRELRKDPQVAAVITTEMSSHPIVVGWDILEQQLGQRMAQLGMSGRAFIICDNNVTHPYGRMVHRSLHKAGIEAHLFTFPPGEKSKSLATCATIYGWLAEMRAERQDTLVAVGGGVAGDMTGFVAATYVRGMRIVHVPTSLLAMVDSSIGGKVAVDLPEGKNLVGAFYHPSLVLADVAALKTLPQRALHEGWAEALKHGLIMDADLVDIYERKADALLRLEPELITNVVARNMAIKARTVTDDERETTGLRMLLNYGHTIGHGLEAAAGYDRYLHGEAVAIGMMGAAMLGMRAGVTPSDVVERQASLIRRYGLPMTYEDVPEEAILTAMTRDKKASSGNLRWVFLDAVGKSSIHGGIPMDEVKRVLRELRG